MRISRAACVALVVAGVGAQFIAIPIALRAVVSAPLVLFLPGYTTIIAAFGEKLSKVETMVFAVGLSLAIVVLSGLALHLVGFLSPLGWALTLGTITLIGAGFISFEGKPAASLAPVLDRRELAMAGGSCLIALVALYQARSGYLSHREFAFTEFWLVPSSTATDFNYTLGFTNHEQAPALYDVEVRLDGRLIAMWSALGLGEDESWTKQLHLPFKATRTKEQRAEAFLYKSSSPGQIYRKVWASFPALDKGRLSITRKAVSEVDLGAAAVRTQQHPSSEEGSD